MDRATRLLTLLSGVALALSVACDREAQGPSVEKVEEAPAVYDGRTVTLSGEVDDVHNSRSFELESDDDPFELWDEELLVVTRSPVQLPGKELEDDDDVIVTGTVRNFIVADIERELGWDLGADLEAEFRNKPVVVATRVSRIDSQAQWIENQDPELMSFTVYTQTYPLEDLKDTKVSFKRVPVQAVADRALWVGYTHTNQLLVSPTGQADLSGIRPGDLVNIQGTLVSMPPVEQAVETFGLADVMPEHVRNQIAQEPLYLQAREIENTGKRVVMPPTRQTGEPRASLGQEQRNQADQQGQTGQTGQQDQQNQMDPQQPRSDQQQGQAPEPGASGIPQDQQLDD